MASNKDLPEDIMVEILARLPVKSLVRFKCLSKPSSALITSAYFINKHFKFSSELARNQRALLISYYRTAFPYWNPIARMTLISDEIFDEEPFDLELPIPGGARLSPAKAVHGPCNGVFCIERKHSLPLILWNPATKETKVLPLSHLYPLGMDFYDTVGFGIDPKTNDFKIVIISYTRVDFANNIKQHPLIGLYNLSSNSWKFIGATIDPFDLVYPNCNLYLNGFYHWKSYDKTNLITSFDMREEVFWRMEIPGCLKSCNSKDWRIAVIDDCVACIKGPSNLTDSSAEIWIMSEYGVQESWTRRYMIAVDFRRFHGLWRYDSSRDSVLEWMTSCYPLTKERELEVLICASVLFTAFKYAESLFPLSVLE